RFLVGRPKRRMRAHERKENPRLQPARVKLARRRAYESADVAPNKRKSRNAEAEQCGNRLPQRGPIGRVVPRPDRGITLASGESSAGQHKRTVIGPQPRESFKCGAA